MKDFFDLRKNKALCLFVCFAVFLVVFNFEKVDKFLGGYMAPNINVNVSDIPEYTDKDYIVLNDNEPYFHRDDVNLTKREEYSKLDIEGRCGSATALVGLDTMPKEERGSIGQIKPSGWHTIKYDIVNDKYLYNRCHLIGYQLTGQNANKRNLITCTEHMNKGAMLDLENKVADYIHKTKNHVLYRSTPLYKEGNLVASGVELEAMSVEDEGAGISFNVYIYNVEPGIYINYLTGESHLQ